VSDGTRAGWPERAALATVIPLRVPEGDERPALKVVPARVRRRRTAAVTVLAIVVMFVVMFGLAAFQTMIAQGQAQLDHLNGQVDAAQESYAKLRLEAARLESPARIVSVAEQRLGLVPPPSVHYLAPSGDDAVAVRQATTGAPASRAAPTSGPSWPSLKPYVGTPR